MSTTCDPTIKRFSDVPSNESHSSTAGDRHYSQTRYLDPIKLMMKLSSVPSLKELHLAMILFSRKGGAGISKHHGL